METLQTIKTRRSVRKYTTAPVDDTTLNQVLEAARWAPSWANTQCWRFIVVRNDAVKTELAGVLAPNNPATNAIKTAPVVIVACAEKNKAGFYKGVASTNKGDWCMFDLGIAMENIALAAHSLGLGTVHVALFDAQKAEAVLGIPEGFCVVEMTPLGYPDGETKAPPRKELVDIVFRDRFGVK
ncbi:MAG: nitroreductase family protein [Dehalococcoidales bacterium]|nr:nitroreductase family protein [Dehalococcoidales bacterium]